MKNSKGFTLIEMLIVLLIISVLILVTIPNVTKHFATIDEKGCDAYVNMVQGQVEAYKIDHKTFPTTIEQLVDEKYLKENETTCPNGDPVNIQEDGSVVVNSASNVSDGS
ncbi:competence type IV pilus major pilin ComGC [Lysinibacillus endophyticus]|uniref:ComG operon protein 3 n=1 Tax=Ureibacillus endophyticus TaxID=1978490 RepID=A0A494YZV9_9BACL|nr:competence type IV pilus major pilin ComGC [Lysinibacillus endophyticus]MCP1145220.1 prepilin-type N-terminal cleavage/methylation domain-containing protein [Lysinibacillus endophyticus]RKQ15798.1 prepilin-type N-terminal cleavage/methylation domain-containing protein [Lysinibacillus endophyticus]